MDIEMDMSAAYYAFDQAINSRDFEEWLKNTLNEKSKSEFYFGMGTTGEKQFLCVSSLPYTVSELNRVKNKKGYDVALVGKGVTFDSGGISLKPSNGMWDMKQDMAGSAVVAASLKAAVQQKLNLNIVGIVGLVENMPSGTASYLLHWL